MTILRRHLLLVEDSPSDRQIILAHLDHDGGWTADSALTLAEARARLADTSYDAVLLDLRLPDGEGLAMVGALTVDVDVPVVVLTGTQESAWNTDVLASGAQDYLLKHEITTASLSRSLRYAVQRHQNMVRLRRAQHRLERYAQAVAHDLRSPLSGVRGFAELISVEEQSQGRTGSRVDGYASRIVAQVKRLEGLVVDLLEDTGRDEEGGEVDLTSVARWVQDLLGSRLDRSGAVLTITRLPRLRGSTQVLRQVLLNLTSNALDHADADPVEMRWTSRRRSDKGWDVVLEDNGRSVPQALIDAGQPMAPTALAPTSDGHGIGMQVAVNGMADHDGHLWLSRGPRGGLTVTLAFPPSASVT